MGNGLLSVVIFMEHGVCWNAGFGTLMTRILLIFADFIITAYLVNLLTRSLNQLNYSKLSAYILTLPFFLLLSYFILNTCKFLSVRSGGSCTVSGFRRIGVSFLRLYNFHSILFGYFLNEFFC